MLFRSRIFPETAAPEVVERKLESLRSRPRPIVRVWHFQEVTAFMLDGCRALNKDVPLDNFKGTTCSTGLPFVETLTAAQKAATASAMVGATADTVPAAQ